MTGPWLAVMREMVASRRRLTLLAAEKTGDVVFVGSESVTTFRSCGDARPHVAGFIAGGT